MREAVILSTAWKADQLAFPSKKLIADTGFGRTGAGGTGRRWFHRERMVSRKS